ncbi:MAG: hypothetical protein HYT80_04590, partial [Euryarchaeota archaeon]|nr:hypothetical protein [Euryarchaeota archaeon]
MSWRIQPASLLTVCTLVFAGLVGLAAAQDSVSGPTVDIQTSFGARSPCKEEWVSFDGSGSRDQNGGALTFTWFLNGQQDPHNFGNSSMYKFQIGGVGTYTVGLLAKNDRGAGTRKDISFQSIECQAPPSASPGTTSTSAVYAHIWVQKVCIEGAPMSGEHSQGAGGASIVSWVWSIKSPSGKVAGLEGKMVTFVGGEEGYHTIVLYVKDANGNTGQATQSDYYFYRCNYQDTASPSPTVACRTYSYYNQETQRNETKEQCDTYTPQPYPTPTTQGSYNHERCSSLQSEYDTYKRDYYYRYEKYKAAGDEQALSDLEAEKNQYVTYWQEQWRAAGCDYAYSANDECGRVFQELQATIEEFKARVQAIWDRHYEDLANARREFGASGYHNESEWKEFESKWQRITSEVDSRIRAELEAFMSRYPKLAQCGYQYYDGRSTDYKTKYGTVAAPTADPYSQARNDCENKMLLVKDEYATRFEELYHKLASVPRNSADYESLRRQISQLELEVQSRIQALIDECRTLYASHYDAPENYKDGAGNLSCYFDEAAKKIECRGQYVSFQGDPQTQVLSRYSCGGQLYFDQIYSNHAFEDFSFSETGDGGTLSIRSSNLKMIIHDSPRGVINVGLVGGTEMYFVPAVHLGVTAEANKVVLKGAGSNGLWLGGGDSFSWDAGKRVLTVKGEATWISESCVPDGSKPDGDNDARYWDAIRARKLGAQVIISDDDGDVGQDNETYDEGME